ncbi:Ig-like domain-containing protein [Paenibacillus caui]|uniref:Ig-like domain-containing protein n=1 Tax=Paenibacillus caui TaxID=2873927 RepID=UPI001CA808F4|nr:Ig-like domain-containing protein [Paenibacillus caui]
MIGNRKVMKWFLSIVLMVSTVIPANVFATTGDVNSIRFDNDRDIVLTVNETTEQLRVIAEIEGASDKDVTNDTAWSSSNSSIVKVEGGLLTPVSKGTATIKADYKGLSASVNIKVTAPFGSLGFETDDDLEMVSGGSEQLKVTTRNTDGTGQVDVTDKAEWSSSNTSVAKVEDGKVTALTLGKATITASYLGSTVQKDVYVRNPYEALILKDTDFVKNAVLFLNDNSKPVTAWVKSSSNSSTEVTAEAEWKSSNPLAAAVSAGVITPKSAGTSTITVSYLGISKEFQVTVYSTVTSFKVASEELDMLKGDSESAPKVTGTLLNEEEQDFTRVVQWKSGNEAAVTVDGSKFKAVDTGAAVLTGTIGSRTVATVTVKVSEKVLLLMPSVESFQLIAGKTASLPEVTAVFGNGDEEDVTSKMEWSLSGASAVIKNGSMKGLVRGSAILTGKYSNGTVKIPVTVEPEVITVVIDPQTAMLNIKRTKSIKVKGFYADGKSVILSTKMNWISSNPAVAAVSNSTVRGVAEGTATLTGTYQGKEYKVTVNVVPKLTKLTASDKRLALSPGSSKAVSVTALYDTGKTETVTGSAEWTSSNTSAVKVTAGKIEAIAKGAATVKAKFGDKTITIYVSVK